MKKSAFLFFCFGLSPFMRLQAVPLERPGEAYQSYLKSLLLESQGNLELAQEELEKALSLAPESAYLHRTSAEFSMRLGRLDKAMDEIDKATELDPKDVKALILSGQIYWAHGKTEKGEAQLKKALELDPDASEALVNLAGALTTKDPKKAIELYSEYLSRHPGEVQMQEQVAQLYQNLGEMEQAKIAWEKALEWAPTSLRAHLALAQMAEVNLDTATAIGHYEAVLIEDNNNLSLLLRIGELRYRSNDISKAYEAFSRAHSLSPDSVSTNFWMAILSEFRGDWKEAVRLLEQVDAKTNDPGVALRLSYYYSQAGRTKQAIRVLNKISEADPKNRDFLGYLAVAYEEDKQFDRAEKTWLKSSAIDPNDPEPYFHMAMLYDRRGKFPKAEESLKKAISIKSDYHVAMNYLGYSYAERNIHLEQAERLINDAIGLEPENGAYLDSMGWVYFKQKKFQKAENFLRTATLKANDPLIWDHLGDALLAKGDSHEAILAWDESLQIKFDQKPVQQKIKKAMRLLTLSAQFNLFVKKAISHFGDLQSIKGMAQIRVCDQKPCFESQANLEYDRGKQLKVEIPGPFAGPLLLMTKIHGKPATLGAIHPILQNAEESVTRAFDRIYDLLSADFFRSLDLSTLETRVQQKNRALMSSSDNLVLTFEEKDGLLEQVEWSGGPGLEVLKLGSYGYSKTSVVPAWIEWEEKKSNFVLHLDLVKPLVSFSPAPSDEFLEEK